MPQTIQTPAGPAEFPDGMPMADIETVLRKQFPPPKPQSLTDRFVGFADDAGKALQNVAGKYGRPAMEMAGGTAGAVLAAPAAAMAGLSTGGPGAAAAEAGGVGTGTALGGHYYDTARDFFTGSKSPSLADQLKTGAQDFSAGAAVVPGGRLVGGALSKAIPVAKAGVRQLATVLDAGATPAAESVRSAALAKVLAQQQAAAELASKAASAKGKDAGLRAAMQAAADAQAAKGVGVSDLPVSQELVANLRAKLNPTGEVGTVLLPEQAKPIEQIIDTLSPRNGPKPDLASIQALRRQIAKPAYTGDQAGFNAIPKGDRKDLVRALSAVENEYTGGLQAPVQSNWAQALEWSKQAEAIQKLAPDLQVAAAKLETLSPKDSADTARSIVDKLAKKGLISDAEHRDFIGLANAATDAQGKAAFRRKLVVYGAAGMGGAEAVRLGGHAIGVLP